MNKIYFLKDNEGYYFNPNEDFEEVEKAQTYYKQLGIETEIKPFTQLSKEEYKQAYKRNFIEQTSLL